MDSSNNNFKSFDDQNTELPEGFGWEDMVEGVYAKMPPKKKRRRLAAWWWFGAAGLLLFAFGTWMLLDSNETVEATTVLAEAEAAEQQDVNATVFDPAEPVEQKIDDQLSATKRLESSFEKEELTSNQVEVIETIDDDRFLSKRLTLNNSRKSTSSSLLNLDSSSALSEIVDNPVDRNQPYISLDKIPQNQKPATEVFLSGHVSELALEEKSEKIKLDVLAPLQPNVMQLLALGEPTISYALPEVSGNPASKLQKDNFLTVESLVTVPVSISSPRNSVFTSPWYGIGGSVGYQKQLGKRFGVSAHYTFQRVTEEFRFTKRDTVPGSELVDVDVNYVDMNSLNLLTTSTRTGEQQFDRFRDILSYNRLNVHQLTLFAHFNQAIGALGALDIGLGGGIQFLSGARGLRLDNEGELVDLSSDLSTFKRTSGTLDGRVRYMFQLSPKLDLTAGLNYSQTLPQELSLRINSELPSVLSGRIGLRWKL